MTDTPMTEERAREILNSLTTVGCGDPQIIMDRPNMGLWIFAKGYLERVEQEKKGEVAVCDCHAWPTVTEMHDPAFLPEKPKRL